MSKAKQAKPKAHARKSPSGAKRWMMCPGSLNLWKRLIEAGKLEEGRKSSKFAAEGTVAHELGEICFLNMEEPESYLGTEREADGFKFIVSQDMVDAVNTYLDYIDAIIEMVDMEAEYPTVGVEVICDLKILKVPDMDGGTSDFVIVSEKLRLIHIIDYKHGKGVAVDIDDNPQTRSYALGAMIEYGVKPGDGWTVHCTIVQPRAFHPDGPIRTEILNSNDLWDWANDKLIPAGLLCDDPDAPLVAGPEQCRFCENGPFCPAQLKLTEESAMIDFDDLPAVVDSSQLADVDMLTPEQKLKIKRYADVIRSFLSSVEERVRHEMQNGSTDYDSHCKLVRRKTNRRLNADVNDDLDSPLLEYLQAEDIFTSKLKGVGDIEKALKAEGFDNSEIKAIMDENTTKPMGGVDVVPLSDKRKALPSSAESDFDDV